MRTGLTFAGAGVFDGTMTPIVQDIAAIPEPGTYALMLAGLSLLGLLARTRRPKS